MHTYLYAAVEERKKLDGGGGSAVLNKGYRYVTQQEDVSPIQVQGLTSVDPFHQILFDLRRKEIQDKITHLLRNEDVAGYNLLYPGIYTQQISASTPHVLDNRVTVRHCIAPSLRSVSESKIDSKITLRSVSPSTYFWMQSKQRGILVNSECTMHKADIAQKSLHIFYRYTVPLCCMGFAH